ncbi:50S ribosomal protein L29 [Parasphingorhabdus halotolerans]|nr:50S ribosomal protein L29 [Parasphingorhabdus halotolerans]
MADKKNGGSAKIEDMRTKTDDQLTADLGDLKKEAFNLRFQAATNQLEKPSRMREVRRTIAQIKTLQNERLAAATSKTTAKEKA